MPKLNCHRQSLSPLSVAAVLLGAALLAGTAGCKKTNTCKTGTALLDLRFVNAAQKGDAVDITVDVLDTPHETLTGPILSAVYGVEVEIERTESGRYVVAPRS